jgi:transcriptional regulator with XRE-family HTH domain
MRSLEPRLFSALLRHWRSRRGMSQLDLAIAAEVSARHVSFLETGRAQPSREMVLRLAFALGIPLRDQNALLRAAGHAPAFPDAPADAGLPPAIEHALTRMLARHEPFPMCVMNRQYDVLRMNQGATHLLGHVIADPAALVAPVNAARAIFDPRLMRPFIVDWERTAHLFLARLQREVLEVGHDDELGALLRSLFEYPDVPASWRAPDFALPSEPCFTVRVRAGGEQLAFLVAVTAFSAPQQVTLDELRIESYFPLDQETEHACSRASA